MNKNILITSISSKIPLIKTVLESKNKFDKSIKVYGTDIDENIIGKYFVEEFFLISKLSMLDINHFIFMCLKNQIRYIIPTRDEDVLYYSSFKEKFLENNIYIFSPNFNVVKKCYDKYLFIEENRVDFNIKTSLDIDKIKNSKKFVVKQRYGSGSKNLGLNLNYEEAIAFSKNIEEPIFQEYIKGDEFSIDSYVDKNCKLIGLIIRKREIIKNGEAVVTCSVDDVKLQNLIISFLLDNEIIGHSNTQVIKRDSEYFLVECNTRFGGASTLSYKMGLESFYWFLCDINNKPLEFIKSDKNYRQIRILQDVYFEC